MTHAILITDCLQHDFVGSIGRYDRLPNALHVGYEESLRLLGENPKQGPLARVISWAHQQPDDELKVVHIRDWHDAQDSGQRSHLEQFGAHCLKDTAGAQFVFDVHDVRPGKEVAIVNATTLSNFIDADLGSVLTPYAAQPVRIGLMGAWTEAKITFLAYDLHTRYPQAKLAVCSALTASSSRQNHFLALDQLERLLGVQVVASLGKFVEFLGGSIADAPLIGFSHKHPELEVRDATDLNDADRQLVRYLFRGCRKVAVQSLDGGFSGNRVLATQSVDLLGHEQVPHVVKIGPQGSIGQERTAFERIEAVLGNAAPHVADFADVQDRGAIKYRYAAMGRGAARSFQKLYESGAGAEQIERILDAVFVDQLGRLYGAADLERCDLLDYYQFSERWVPGVRQRVQDILGEQGTQSILEFPGGRRVPNITSFYEQTLKTLPRVARAHYLSHVHGDLNGANIIVDGPGNVWLIDFFHSHRGHVLRDLIKLENDVLYIYTKLTDEKEYEDALQLTDHLLTVEDLAAGVTRPAGADNWAPQVQRALRSVQQLRSYYPVLVKADRDAAQLLMGQVRYAVHTLGFAEASPLQKRWALYTACSAAAQLRRRGIQTQRLRVDWLPQEHTSPGRIGLTWLPGRRDAGRVLSEDVAVLKDYAIDSVVCLLSAEEFARYGVEDLLQAYRAAGLNFFALPVIDGRVPHVDDMRRLIAWIGGQMHESKRVLVHCVGGLGRAGTVGACWLSSKGMSADRAIEVVRQARSQRAVETEEQVRFIRDFA